MDAEARQRYYATGLEHARAYARTHGHLVPGHLAVHDGFPVGQWLARRRATAKRGKQPRAEEEPLTAIDPWWNPSWGLTWQRAYHQARTGIAGRQLGDVEEPALRAWLYLQCTRYTTLHHDQQHLLNQIGLTADAARTYRYALSREAPAAHDFDTGRRHAAAYAAAHGHLAPRSNEHWNGFPLGRWLNDHRRRANRRAGTSQRSAALAKIDPWWNPPWALTWQRSYHQARTTGPHTARTRRWAAAQQQHWPRLHPQQQHLLTAIGITPAAPAARPRPYTPRNRPDGAGLEPARSYTALHGHLTPGNHTTHNGFPLGRWLTQQRTKARRGTLSPRLTNALQPPWTPGGTRPGPTPGPPTTTKPAPPTHPHPPSNAGPPTNTASGPAYTPTNDTS